MKTKTLLVAALLGATAMSASAGARFGINIALPMPVVVSTLVVYATPVIPTPVVYTRVVTPAPVAVVAEVPPCPGVGYVWVPGYWSVCATGKVWVPGAWHYRPAHVVYRHWHDGYRR